MFSMVLVGSGSSHFLIRIRIQGNDTDSTDPDPQHWRVEHIFAEIEFTGFEFQVPVRTVGTFCQLRYW